MKVIDPAPCANVPALSNVQMHVSARRSDGTGAPGEARPGGFAVASYACGRTGPWAGLVVFLVFASLLAAGVPTAAAEPFPKGRIWEVSRPGIASSHVFGTMHVADPRVLDLPPEVRRAFEGSRRFVMEMRPDDMTARRFVEATELPNDGRLADQVGEPALRAIEDRLRPLGIPAERIARLKPWAALLLLTAPAATGEPVLDADLYARARASGKRIEELESVEEQIAVLDGLPEDTQVALLAVALRRADVMDADLERSIAAYLKGDLRTLARLGTAFPGATADELRHLALLEKKVLHDRSVVMAHRVQSSLRMGGAFVAVGALHLYGRKGMLQALREDGWTVRRVR